MLSESLSGLSVAEATDERLWVTLCFRDYSEYVKKRWPLRKDVTLARHVQTHWFVKGSRERMRDNAISRLWWMAHITEQVPEINADDVLRTLFFNNDYRKRLMESNSSTNSINVLGSILSISQKAFDKGIKYNREKFLTFMRRVDLISKRTSLPSLGSLDLNALLLPIYCEAYDIKEEELLEGLLRP